MLMIPGWELKLFNDVLETGTTDIRMLMIPGWELKLRLFLSQFYILTFECS